MIDVEVIDAHHHLADLRRSYPWLEGPPVRRYHGDDTPLRRSYLLDDYRSDTASIPLVGSIHVENGAADPLAESRWIDELIVSGNLPSAQVAKVALDDPAAAALLEQHAEISSVRGIRDILSWHEDPLYTHRDRGDLITDPRWLAGFRRLEALGFSFDLQVFPAQLGQAATLAGTFPGIRIVLDHAGMPIARDDDAKEAWRNGLVAFAAHPNTAVKVSAIGTNDHHWTEDSMRSIVLDTIDAFGPERTMFGSNFPVDGLYSTLDELYASFDSITSGFSRREREFLFAHTARSFYRLG